MRVFINRLTVEKFAPAGDITFIYLPVDKGLRLNYGVDQEQDNTCRARSRSHSRGTVHHRMLLLLFALGPLLLLLLSI